jgi:hypothetical protein
MNSKPMADFLRAGGFSMWFVILFSGVTLIAAVIFAVRADLKKVAFIRGMTAATVFSILCGVLANLLAVARHVGADEQLAKSAELPMILIIGFGESITPAILGFAVLAVTWLIVAAGVRRAQDQSE